MKHIFRILIILLSINCVYAQDVTKYLHIGQTERISVLYADPPCEGFIYAETQEGPIWVNAESGDYLETNFTFELMQGASFSNGLARIRTKDKESLYGFINTKGKVIVSPKYIEADNFSSGFAKVTEVNGTSYFIDTKGVKNKNLSTPSDYGPPSQGMDLKGFSVSEVLYSNSRFNTNKTTKDLYNYTSRESYAYGYSDSSLTISPLFSETLNSTSKFLFAKIGSMYGIFDLRKKAFTDNFNKERMAAINEAYYLIGSYETAICSFKNFETQIFNILSNVVWLYKNIAYTSSNSAHDGGCGPMDEYEYYGSDDDFIITEDGVRVREGPNASEAILGKLTKGTFVKLLDINPTLETISGNQGFWIQVEVMSPFKFNPDLKESFARQEAEYIKRQNVILDGWIFSAFALNLRIGSIDIYAEQQANESSEE